ncbi:MAG: AI-2E family transporter [Elainellaceae cyanobacterium]
MNNAAAKRWIAQLNNARLLRYLLLFAFGWAIAQVIAYFEAVIAIFTIATILAFLLHYPVQWLKRLLPHGLAVTLVFLLGLAILAGLAVTLGLTLLSQSQQLFNTFPELLDYLFGLLERIENWLQQRNLQLDLELIEEEARSQAWTGIGLGLATVQRLFASLVEFLLIAVVAFFMLLDGARLWRFLLKLFPEPIRDKLTFAVQHNFLGFFWGRLLLSIFFGLSAFLVFLFLQVPYPLLLATIAGLFDLIPGIGATIGISLVCLVILPQGVFLSLKVLVSCILLQQVEENLLMPRIMQGSINLNPVVMFLALLIGAKIAGLFGIFLAIPIAGTLISLFEIDEMRGEELPPKTASKPQEPANDVRVDQTPKHTDSSDDEQS